MDSGSGDFLAQYRTISNKLKKKFLRKPNVAEASEQFGSLSRQLQEQEECHYAAICCLAVARCEQTLSNVSGEMSALVQAARLFLDSEVRLSALHCPSLEEHLQSSVSCYNHAIRLHLDHNHHNLAAALCIEMGDMFVKLHRLPQAIVEYERAAKLQSDSVLDCVHTRGQIVSCHLQMGNYDDGLQVLTEMYKMAEHAGGDIPIGVYRDILVRCEITRVLLLLILNPPPQRIHPDHAALLEKYSWVGEYGSVPVHFLSEDIFLILQSVVLSSQSNDVASLSSLQTDFWLHLSNEQRDLMHVLVKSVRGRTWT